MYQFDIIPPTAAEASIRKQITERNNVSESYGKRNRLIIPPAKRNRAFPTGNALLYISLSSVALIASFTSRAILNDLFAICNSRLLPTNQIVNYAGRVRPIQGRTLFLFCI